MRTIYKQELPIEDVQEVEIFKGATILHIGVQRGRPCMWYECDTDAPRTTMTIMCYGTGHPMPDKDEADLNYLGTVLLHDDRAVFHFYERK
ncbi:MAG: hypothetical protein IJ640_00950 [Prevotella sp.]|nr:hypothetical protein [Prevotella sp.]